MSSHGYTFPKVTFQRPYLISFEGKSEPGNSVEDISELAFFGRLQKRKGLHYFANAAKRLSRLYPKIFSRPITLSFLGKQYHIEEGSVLEYIKENLDDMNFELMILSNLDSEEVQSRCIYMLYSR